MCGTTRSDGSRVCSYCGYIFEDQLSENTASVEAPQSMNDLMTTVADSNAVPAQRENQEAEKLVETEIQVMSKSAKKVLQGTLVLTNKRIALINPENANQLSSGIERALEKAQIVIPIDSVDSVSGQRGILRVSLIVDWHNPPGSAATTKTEFVQRSRAPNQKAINDWIPLIENQVWGESKEEGFGPADLSE